MNTQPEGRAAAEAPPALANHFTLLVYPFQHTLGGADRGARLAALGARWRPWWARLDPPALVEALDTTNYFLPYISPLLFPETELLPPGHLGHHAEAAARLGALPAAALAARLPLDSVLRLTYDPAALAALQPLRLELRRDPTAARPSFAAPLRLRWVDVVLFPQRIGFLILRVELAEAGVTVARLTEVLAALRPVHPPNVGWSLARWVQGSAGVPIAAESRDLVDFWLQGLASEAPSRAATLPAFLDAVPAGEAAGRYSETDVGVVYGQAFHQYSYACLDATPPAAPPTDPPSPFASPVQQALYELATAASSRGLDTAPHPRGLKTLLDQAHFAFWSNWEGLALQDNAVFLGVRPSPFTLTALPANVASEYLYLYLLTLYQKIRLSLLAGDTVRRGADLHRNLREARTLADHFMMFRNHYWFNEVTPKAQGNALYARFQAGLGVQALYTGLRESMAALQTYYEDKDQRRIRSILNFGGFVGLPTLILGQLNAAGLIARDVYGFIALGMYTISALIWLIWTRRGRA